MRSCGSLSASEDWPPTKVVAPYLGRYLFPGSTPDAVPSAART
jgi:hypothetical protein